MLGYVRNHLAHDLAIDLGTANTSISVPGKGIVFCEPSVVAVREAAGASMHASIAAVGREAHAMTGRAPANIRILRPIQAGVIADLTIAQEMLRQFVSSVQPRRLFAPRPRVVINVPCLSTQVERRAIRDSVHWAGAGSAHLLDTPIAAAIGAGLPVTEANGSMVVDIGAGTTEVGIVSLGGMVYKGSIPVAGNRFDQAIMQFVRKQFGILIGEPTAEAIKIRLGCAFPGADRQEMEVNGRSINEGVPRSLRLSTSEVLEALAAPLDEIVMLIKSALEATPPELSADLSERGIMLTGGSALLRDLDRLLIEETGLTVLVADDPQRCAVRGSAQALQQFEGIGALFAAD